MIKFNYKQADYMENLIKKFNSYKNEIPSTINKGKYSGKYLYHLSKPDNLNKIKRNGLVPYKLIVLNTYFDLNIVSNI